jgi:hypothetical protein
MVHQPSPPRLVKFTAHTMDFVWHPSMVTGPASATDTFTRQFSIQHKLEYQRVCYIPLRYVCRWYLQGMSSGVAYECLRSWHVASGLFEDLLQCTARRYAQHRIFRSRTRDGPGAATS